MRINKALFRWVTLAAHVVAAAAVVLTFLQTRAMTGFCVVAATLIGCGSVNSVPGQSVSTYAAFGSLMGYAFWISVSAINQGEYLALVPAALLVAGSVWFLQATQWPSFVFAACVAAVMLAVAVSSYRQPYDVDGWEPDEVRRSAVTSIGVVSVGLMYLFVSRAEAVLVNTRKPKRKQLRKSNE